MQGPSSIHAQAPSSNHVQAPQTNPVPDPAPSSQQPGLTPPITIKPSVSESTVIRNKEARQSELEAMRLAKKEAKKKERRAKAAAAAKKRQEAQQAASAADLDDESFASNISFEFGSKSDSETMSIEGDDPAPDSVKEMLKNAVQGNVDPRAWMGGWNSQK